MPPDHDQGDPMLRPFLVGQKLYLRTLEESDVGDDYVGWLNDPDVTRYLEAGKYPSTLESIRDYVLRFHNSTSNILLGIVDRATDKHIGNVTLNNIKSIHRFADTGILIGPRAFRGKGYGYEAWSLVIAYAFDRLGLRKIIAGTIAENKASASTLVKLGFKLEGTFRSQYLVEGSYRDAYRFGLFKEEFLPAFNHK